MCSITPPQSSGLERIVRRFLFFPKQLQGCTKWLTISWVRQRSEKIKDCKPIAYKWVDINWANRKDDKNVLSGWRPSNGH